MLISVENHRSVQLVTLKREKRLNALNRLLLEELLEYFTNLDREVKGVVLTGSERAFSAGVDIQELSSTDEVRELISLGNQVIEAIAAFEGIVIAAVKGYVIGGGLELALGCDWIYASKEAQFALPEVKLGLIPGFRGIELLSDAIGIRKAKELIVTGGRIDAKEALKIGLCQRVYSSEELIEESLRTAEEIAQNSIDAISSVKRLMKQKEDGKEEFFRLFSSDECKDRLKQFMDRGL